MKQTKLWLTTIAVLLCSLAASAHDFEVDGIYYNITSSTDLAVAITFKGSSYNQYSYEYTGVVTIPTTVTHEGVGYSVTSIENYAFYGCSSLTSITIPEGVTSIGSSAFSGCSSLTSITISESVVEIESLAFEGCTGLTSITSNAVTPPTIGYSSTFRDVDKFISVYVPASSVSAYQSAPYWGEFTNIQPIDTPVVEEPITSVGQLSNTKLYYVSQPHHSKGLTSWAVAEDGSELKSNVDLGITADSGDSRQQFAFINRDGAYYLYHAAEKKFVNANGSLSSTPVSPIYFGAGAYENTFVLYFDDTHYINVGGRREMVINNWKTLDGGNSCSIVPVGEFDPSEALDKEQSFLGYTKIGTGEAELTFAAMSLTEVVIPETVVIDGEVCRVTSIGNNVFEGNSNLMSVTILEGVSVIGERAFYDCSNLTSIVIPESVMFIGWEAFSGTAWYNNQLDGIIYINNVLYKYKGAMLANTTIEVVDGVVSISPRAFEGYSNLVSVVIPESVISIGYMSFYNCANLVSVDIPYGLEEIEYFTFQFCKKLESLTIPESVISIGTASISHCESLTSIIIPNSVTVIGAYAFDYTGLESVVLGEGVQTIGNNAFQGCSSLTSITSNAVIPPTIEGSYAFDGVDKSIPVYVPASSVSAYQSASYWSDFTNIQPVIEIGDTSDWTSSNQGQEGSVSSKTYILEVGAGDILTFDWMVSSESGCDKLIVTLDGTEVLNKSGEQSGTFEKIFAASGTCTLVVKYSKDGSVNNGSDCARVYNLTFPATRDVILSDGDASFVQNEDKGCTSITYTRNFKNTNWQALYVPFEIPYDSLKNYFEVADLNNVHQYDRDNDGVTDETVIEAFKMTSGVLEANYPYLIRAKEAGEKSITVTDAALYATEENSIDCSSVRDKFTFTGTYSSLSSAELPQGEGYYTLIEGEWKPVTEAVALGAFRFFLKVDSRSGAAAAEARSIRMRIIGENGEDDTTGIDNLESTGNDGKTTVIYDLQGRKVLNTEIVQEGVYIINGKKVVIK